MRMSISQNNIATLIMSSIPFYLFVAIDETFNIQSIFIPIVALMLLFFLFRGCRKITVNDMLIYFLFGFSTIMSLIINMFFLNEKITILYLIRIVYTFVVLIFFCIGTKIQLDEKGIRCILICNIIVGVLLSLYFIFVNKIWYVNLLGTQIDKNFSGAFLTIASELSFWFCYYEKKICKKVLFGVMFVVIFVGLFFSGSRAAILVGIIGIIIIVAEDMLIDIKRRRQFLKTVFAIVIIVGLFLIIFPKLNTSLSGSEQFQWYWNRYFVNSYFDYSNNTRIKYWTEGLHEWLECPIFGHGVGIASVTKAGTAVAHNTFIDYLVDYGILGLIGFLLMCMTAIKPILFCKKRSFKALPISIFLFSIILSMNRNVVMWYSLILCRHLSKYIECVETINTENQESF